MKKDRNTCGCLSISTEAAAKLEKEAAERYYCHGQIYFNESDRRTYICQKKSDEFTYFIRLDGRQLIVPTETLGTFLPDVASEGMAIRRIK